MTRLDTLKSLQTRIREATGADRELDWLILCNVSMPWLADKARSWLDDQYVEIDGRISDPEEICWISWEDGKRRYEHCPHFTTDPDGLGACVALQRSVLPGWTRVVDASAPELGIAVELLPPDDAPPELQSAKIKGDHDLETHAHIDAIIAARIAVIAEEEAKEKADV